MEKQKRNQTDEWKKKPEDRENRWEVKGESGNGRRKDGRERKIEEEEDW